MKTFVLWIATGASVIAWAAIELGQDEQNLRTADENTLHETRALAPVSRLEAPSPSGNDSKLMRTDTAHHATRGSPDLVAANVPATRMEAVAPTDNDTVPEFQGTTHDATSSSIDLDAANEAIGPSPLEQRQLALVDTGDEEMLRIYSRSIAEITAMDEASRSIANSELLQSELEIINRNDDELLQHYTREGPFSPP